jgi:hypothetical protein
MAEMPRRLLIIQRGSESFCSDHGKPEFTFRARGGVEGEPRGLPVLAHDLTLSGMLAGSI